MEITTLCGMSAEDIFAHDFVNSSPLVDGNIPKKPDKSMVVSELKTNLIPSDYQFCKGSNLTMHTIVAFMSKVRQLPNMLSYSANFGDVIHAVFKSLSSVRCSEMFHVVFDSYNDFSVKDVE